MSSKKVARKTNAQSATKPSNSATGLPKPRRSSTETSKAIDTECWALGSYEQTPDANQVPTPSWNQAGHGSEHSSPASPSKLPGDPPLAPYEGSPFHHIPDGSTSRIASLAPVPFAVNGIHPFAVPALAPPHSAPPIANPYFMGMPPSGLPPTGLPPTSSTPIIAPISQPSMFPSAPGLMGPPPSRPPAGPVVLPPLQPNAINNSSLTAQPRPMHPINPNFMHPFPGAAPNTTAPQSTAQQQQEAINRILALQRSSSEMQPQSTSAPPSSANPFHVNYQGSMNVQQRQNVPVQHDGFPSQAPRSLATQLNDVSLEPNFIQQQTQFEQTKFLLDQFNAQQQQPQVAPVGQAHEVSAATIWQLQQQLGQPAKAPLKTSDGPLKTSQVPIDVLFEQNRRELKTSGGKSYPNQRNGSSTLIHAHHNYGVPATQ